MTVPSPTPRLPIGSGVDTLTLNMAEDAWQGDAQFTIAIDGVLQGGTQTVTASKMARQSEPILIKGNFGTSRHTVTINFLNDAYGGSAQTDRNLYVLNALLNGAAVPNSAVTALGGGPQSFGFTGSGGTVTPPVTPPPPTPPSTPPPASFPTVVVGSGPDTILIGLNEDAYNGDAQFTLSVDGRQLGGTLSTQASHAAGQTQLFALKGDFGSGMHRVGVNFLNDAWGGTAQTDRNLYVSSLSYNGVESPTNSAALFNSGMVTLGVGSAAAQDSITFLLTEDAYQGDAQVALSLDGKLLGMPTITFLNSGGVAEAFTYTGNFGGKGVPHTATIDFLNDAWGGTATTDRNVYVKSIVFDGVARPELATTLLGGGAVNFILPAS